jgi:hypothetical protein
MGMCASGGGTATLKKWSARWGIPTRHFDPYAHQRGPRTAKRKPLAEVMVENSTFNRGHLKRRLYDEGLKAARCELCGQGEIWRGVRISLILDHINGNRRDHRLQNLRIVCPNCAATLPTHCGRNVPRERNCAHCGVPFTPKRGSHLYCSGPCGVRDKSSGPRPETRKVERPPVDQLLREVDELGYVAVGRKYGVSDNAIRKWLRSEGIEPPRRRNPKRRRGSDMRSADRKQFKRARIRVRHFGDRDDLEGAAAVARECLQLLQ